MLLQIIGGQVVKVKAKP